MKPLSLLIAFVPLIFGVLAGLPERTLAADNDKVAAELHSIIDNGEPVLGNETSDDRIIEVFVFYASDRDYKPIWVRDSGPKSKAKEVIEVFKKAGEMGLNPDNYRVADIEKMMGAKEPRALAELEMVLTRAFIDFGRDVNRGRVLPQSASKENAITSKEIGALTLIDGAENAEDITQFIKTLEPQTPEYARLKDALAKYRAIEAKGGWPVIAKGPALKPGMKDARVPTLRKYLTITGDLDQEGSGDSYDAKLVEAVKHYQERNGLTADGVIAQTTLEIMNVPVGDRVHQIALNMERRRWMDDDLGSYYVFVNVADQELQVVKNGKTIHTARVVVGKPYTRTPVFSDKMKYVVLNPYWNVPPSIANNEYLPKLKKDPGYLKRQNIKVIGSGGGEINPYSVNWASLKRVPYQLRQDSGPKNALGRVKFMFPNKFNVYLHDTPSKSLFAKDLRIFSHGCMRVEDPLAFATLLLGDQGWTRAKIDAQIAAGDQRVINLKEQIPVHVTYLTAWVNKDGAVNFRRDPYNRDGQLAQTLGDSIVLN
ncbi:MAG: murein L,D-transpeptidase [Parvibaculaceae bacterium]